MPIDFHQDANRRSYSNRDADVSWRSVVGALVEPTGTRVVDIGCGGGVYTRAWHDLRAATVTGVDFSGPILDSAQESQGALPGVRFILGDAAATGLPPGAADIVFERALIHHVADLPEVIGEARRLLRPGGVYLVQDRTPDDVALPGRPPIRAAGCSRYFRSCGRSRTAVVPTPTNSPASSPPNGSST